MLVTNAISSVITLLICIAAGTIAGKLNYINEETERRLSKLTLHFSVPCLLFFNCQQYLSPELIKELGGYLLLPGLTILISYTLAIAVAKLFRIKRENFGLFCVMFGLSNAIFIGLPVCLAIFGEESMPLVAAYFPFNTVVFWTLGAMGLAADGGVKLKPGWATIKQVFSPPLIGTILGAFFALIEITPPVFLMDALRYLGNITIPAALILAGCTLSRMGKGMLKIPKEGWLTIAGRFIIGPLIALGICLLAGAPQLATRVYVVEAAMPVMGQAMLLARAYNANYRLTAQMITLTTLLGLLYIPFLIYFLELAT
jgi:predicted permease